MQQTMFQWVLVGKNSREFPGLLHLQTLERLWSNDGRSRKGEIQINDGKKCHADHPGQEHGHHGLSLEIMGSKEEGEANRRRGSYQQDTPENRQESRRGVVDP